MADSSPYVRAEKRFKKALFSCISNLFLKKNHRKDAMPLVDSIRKVIVLRQDNRIGNLLFITPLLRLLRDNLPLAQIHVVVGGFYPEVLRHNPCIDAIHCYNQLKFIRMPWKFVAFIRNLRRLDADVVIDCKRVFSFNNAALMIMCGARARVGFDLAETRQFLTAAVDQPRNGQHESKAIALLATPLIGEKAAGPLEYFLTDEEKKQAIAAMQKLGIDGHQCVLGVNPGARGEKRWPETEFMAVAKAFLERTKKTIAMVILGPDEKKLKRFFLRNADERIKIIMPENVRQLGVYIQCCHMFLSNDTGALHLASALKKPCLALFKHSSSILYGPRGEHDIILEKGDLHQDRVLLSLLELHKKHSARVT